MPTCRGHSKELTEVTVELPPGSNFERGMQHVFINHAIGPVLDWAYKIDGRTACP